MGSNGATVSPSSTTWRSHGRLHRDLAGLLLLRTLNNLAIRGSRARFLSRKTANACTFRVASASPWSNGGNPGPTRGPGPSDQLQYKCQY